MCKHIHSKGNKAYAFSLLVTILGIVILIAGLYRTFSKKRKPVDAKVIAQVLYVPHSAMLVQHL